MTTRTRKELTRTWLALLGLTAVSMVAVTYGHGGLVVVAVLLALAFLKMRLIVLDFLGLRDAEPVHRRALFAWCLIFLAAALARHALMLSSGS
ncbi:MAG: cytochrome C oxidase subunit IV family protein [Phyllobacterium sp.]